jgi:hypothetical protein
MSRVKTAVIQRNKEKAVIALAACLLVLTALYVYFLSASIVHVVMRQEVSRSITEQQTAVAALESSYMTAQHRLSANVASLDGYTKADDKVYLSRVPGTLVLND